MSKKYVVQVAASEYWNDVCYNQWLLALQGIVLIIVILTMAMGTWIEHECNDIVDDNSVATWRLAIKRLQETIIDIGTKLRYYVKVANFCRIKFYIQLKWY